MINTMSVIVPCFNEARTLEACLDRVLAIQDRTLALQIVVVDDGSTDGSVPIAARLAGAHPEITLLRHVRNRGKGAALRTGLAVATGDVVTIQDADLEYDPEDLRRLAEPILRDEADVVFGSRFYGRAAGDLRFAWHVALNRCLTWLSNRATGLRLTDVAACYKVFRRSVLAGLDLKEDGFGIDVEVAALIARSDARIRDMAISYRRRTYAEGKKLKGTDGLRIVYCILRHVARR